MADNVTVLFENLGAMLTNQVWSWGAVHSDNGSVFLRIWQDKIGSYRKFFPSGTFCDPSTMVCYIGCHDRNIVPDRLGWIERKEHIDLIKNGAQGWGIQLTAKKSGSGVKDEPHDRRGISSFDNKNIWKFGEIFVAEDPYGGGEDYWVTLIGRPKISSLLDKNK